MGARDWIEERLEKATIENLDFTMNLPPGAVAADGGIPDEAMTFTFDARDVKAHYVMGMTLLTAVENLRYFAALYSVPTRSPSSLLDQVGLGYIKIGQQATTLSGGEAQRVKLSKELSRRAITRTLSIVYEPTTALQLHDLR